MKGEISSSSFYFQNIFMLYTITMKGDGRMLRIRNNIFETNSSSAHSIVTTKNSIEEEDWYREGILYDNRSFLQDKTLILRSDKLIFGQFFEILDSPIDKLEYVIASYGETVIKELEDLLKKYSEGKIDKIVIKEEDGFEKFKYGCIDHDSEFLLQNFFEENNITIEELIFSSKYIIITDSNDGRFVQLVRNGLISADISIYTGDSDIEEALEERKETDNNVKD